MTMFLGRKLKVFSILTFVGVVLMTISFVSPGWVNCKLSNLDKFSFEGWDAHLSAGLWYFTLCLNVGSFRTVRRPKCHSAMYPIDQPYLDTGLSYLYVDPAYGTFRGLGRSFLLEIQIVSSIGMVCAVLGFIATIVYTRSLAKSRFSGLVACICLSLAGGTYIATVVKTVKATSIYKDHLMTYTGWDTLHLYCPWGLAVGGIGGLLVLVSAVGHLCILSRNKTNDDIRVYQIYKGTNQGVVSQHPYTTIAPTGYDATIGLKVPLVHSMETNEVANSL